MIVTYGPGEFMGEIGLLTGQRAYLTAVVSAPGRILRIAVEQVHTVMDQELELSELILRAFLVRLTRHRFIDRLRQHRQAIELEVPLAEDEGADALTAQTASPSEVARNETNPVGFGAIRAAGPLDCG